MLTNASRYLLARDADVVFFGDATPYHIYAKGRRNVRLTFKRFFVIITHVKNPLSVGVCFIQVSILTERVIICKRLSLQALKKFC